jgi:hypothetical protein
VEAEHSPDDAAKQGGADAPVEAWHELKSPVDFSKTVGRICVRTQSATLSVSIRSRELIGTAGYSCFPLLQGCNYDDVLHDHVR